MTQQEKETADKLEKAVISGYYEAQINKLITTSEYLPVIQITDGEGNKTKCLSLTPECINSLIKWLELLKNKA